MTADEVAVAIISGKLSHAYWFFESDPSLVNARDSSGRTPLHHLLVAPSIQPRKRVEHLARFLLISDN